VLSKDIWLEISKQARTKTPRKIAISYVTTDHIGLRAGDVLITDASEKAIRTNQTDAKLLRELHGNGVTLHSHTGLHSKVLLLGRHAIVGSANTQCCFAVSGGRQARDFLLSKDHPAQKPR
jgi:hypothetical protein